MAALGVQEKLTVCENWKLQRGRFITFEGIDGCGKTTQFRMLGAWLREHGRDAIETVEPGGTSIGQQIRKILLDPASADIQPRTELLLYFASRAQNVDQVIRPALDTGRIVLCDRFTDSTLVYQGAGRGIDTQVVLDLDRIACPGLETGCHSADRYRSRNQSHARQAAQ